MMSLTVTYDNKHHVVVNHDVAAVVIQKGSIVLCRDGQPDQFLGTLHDTDLTVVIVPT